MNGSLLIDKPDGMTSHDVVSRVRRAARTRRVGHAGTLDPFATGLLVVCVGYATRLMQFLVGHDKEYIATVRLGFATDTQDLTGKQITALQSSNRLSEEEVREALIEMVGPQLQLPPMYSAKKIGGERLYKAAREGREVAREPVAITVHSTELLSDSGAWMRENAEGTCDFRIRVRCSSGTYVRTLAHDLGNRLSTGAHLAALRRTAIGQFDVANAISLEDAQRLGEEGRLSDKIISLAGTASHLKMIELDDEKTRLVLNGRQIILAESDQPVNVGEPLRLCDSRGSLIAVGEVDATRKAVKPLVVFNDQR
jgi:tRNA pseudouridine55 synthase